jgi:YHS domain-containing protein
VSRSRIGRVAAAGALWAVALAVGGGVAAASHPKHPKDAKQEKPTKPVVEKCTVKNADIVNPSTAPMLTVNDRQLKFCCGDCLATFKQAPEKYLKALDDPVSGFHFRVSAQSPRLMHNGVLYVFMSPTTKTKFEKNPDVWIRILRNEPPQ